MSHSKTRSGGLQDPVSAGAGFRSGCVPRATVNETLRAGGNLPVYSWTGLSVNVSLTVDRDIFSSTCLRSGSACTSIEYVVSGVGWS
jgi:hypothetical protein